MGDYAKVAWHLLTCSKVHDCATCELNKECVPCELYRGGSSAIEELMAQVRDKDYLIQQQADEIERLRREVKKQQDKMIELAKKLPKRGKWTEIEDYDGGFYYQCSVCGEEWYFTEGTPADNNANYCPRCGAKMEVQE